MSVIKRLLQYIEYKGISKYKFYQITGLSNGFLDKGENIGTDKCENIIYHYPDINAEWLITGHGDMIKRSRVSSPDNAFNSGIPLVNTEVIAGMGNDVFCIEEKDVQARYVVPDFENIDFMVRVKGRSMEPNYNGGDIVACRIIKERKFIQWNRAHVISTQEQGMLIKRLKKGSNKELVTAISDNADYDSFEIPTSEITGIALVVGIIRLE